MDSGEEDTKYLEDCILCPRSCHVDRTKGHRGYCGQTSEIKVARAALHMWEEPCISGDHGSGTVFFSGCTLGCVYCQNLKISKGFGKTIPTGRLCEIFIELEEQGANNINLVTPTHFVPQIIKAVDMAREKGLCLPIVYNTSGYEKIETLKLLEGYVDIWLPDLKYQSAVLSQKYSHCADYFEYASEAIEEMVRQAGKPVFNNNGMMTKGVIVRHLVLPGMLEDSKQVIRFLYETFGNSIFISMMNQFTPMAPLDRFSELNRKVTVQEYNELVDYAVDLGVENGFIQEGDTASESFIPQFDNQGV